VSTTNLNEDELLPQQIYLIDQSPHLVNAWRDAFSRFPEFHILKGDYFQQPADAMVSPANSFGIMDGGLDLAIRNEMGYSIQGRVQDVIVSRYHGELPVGAAEIVPTGDQRWKYLIAAPTMRIPESVSGTLNAYLVFRAILVAIENFNRQSGRREIDSLVCSGLGTGVGGMSPSRCARQMLLAYKAVLGPPVIGRFESIHRFHAELRQA